MVGLQRLRKFDEVKKKKKFNAEIEHMESQ